MNTNRVTGIEKSSVATDLYYVGGVAAHVSESDLSNFFVARLVPVQSLVIHRPKSTAKKGYAFLATSTACDLISMTGSKFELLGCEISVEPASDPSQKLVTPEDRSSKKVFIGDIPHPMTNAEILSALSVHGQVERLTRFKVKSDRTKYCYAIMQHLEDVQTLVNMKQLKVADHANPETQICLQLGPFIPKKTTDPQDQGSKDADKELNQETRGTPSASSALENSSICPRIEDGSFRGLGLPNDGRPGISQSLGLMPSAQLSSPQKVSINFKSDRNRNKTEYRELTREYLALSVFHRHELGNIRFNILLD